MVVLRVPENGYDLDDQDVGCSWEELVVKQHRGDFGEITKEDLEVGDTLAMLDRNCITEEFVRRVFVLAATEEDVIVFDEHGQPIDEPGDFVEGGWQQLHGDQSFMEEWTGTEDGYYRLGVPEAPAHEPSPAQRDPAATAAAAAAAAAVVQKVLEGDVRIQECFKMSDDVDDTVGKWFGGQVLAVGRDSCLIGFDDGDLSVHSKESIKWLAEMGKLKLLEETRGLVAGIWQAEKALACSSIRINENYQPVGALLGDGVVELCGKPVYSSHHLSLSILEGVLSSSKTKRPSRGGGGAGDDKRGGLATLRHGDFVHSTGPAAEGPATEIVFGVMNFYHRKQQHRYLITYDEQVETPFSVGSWTGWRRVPVNDGAGEFDPDAEGALVQTAASKMVSEMDARWQASPLTAASLDILHSAWMGLELPLPLRVCLCVCVCARVIIPDKRLESHFHRAVATRART